MLSKKETINRCKLYRKMLADPYSIKMDDSAHKIKVKTTDCQIGGELYMALVIDFDDPIEKEFGMRFCWGGSDTFYHSYYIKTNIFHDIINKRQDERYDYYCRHNAYWVANGLMMRIP